MSIRCSGFARRNFIIGSRLCPPAMTRAPGTELLQRRDRAVHAGCALVLEWGRSLHWISPAVTCRSALGLCRFDVGLTTGCGGVLQVGLDALRQLRPGVDHRVGLVARTRVDAARGRRLVRSGRLSENRAAELGILRQYFARRVGAAELGGDDAFGGDFRPRAFLAHLYFAWCRPAALLARRVLHRRVRADHRRPRQRLGPRLTLLGIQEPGSQAAALDVAKRGPRGLPTAIGASRPRRASVRVPWR